MNRRFTTRNQRYSTILKYLLFMALLPLSTNAGALLGPRGGYDFDADKINIGAEAEFGKALETFRFAPSIDFGLGDNSVTAINGDFRLYLFHLPETGNQFYGSIGPTLVIVSPNKGKNDTNLGLSLVAGIKIPMKSGNRYHLETRFGVGDISNFKLMFTLLFNI